MKDNEKVIVKYSWENLCSTEYHDYIPLVLVQNGKSTNPDIVSDVSPDYIKFNNSSMNRCVKVRTSEVPNNSLMYYKKSEKCQMKEEEWNKKAFNKLTHNIVNRVTLVLSELPGNKLKLSLFRFRKEKRAGFQNFKKSSDDVHITINRDTKNWFYTQTSFSNRKRNVSTSKNPFIWVEDKLETAFKIPNIFGWYRVVTHNDAAKDNDPVRKEMVKSLIKIHDEVANRLKQEPNSSLSRNIINDSMPTFGYNLGVLIGQWFCEEHKIKLPNHWNNYFFNYYPGIKRMRRTNMKLLPAIIQAHGIKSKYINQLLNEYPVLNINDLVMWFVMLGPDFFRELPINFLTQTSSSDFITRMVTPNSKKSENRLLIESKKLSKSLTTQEKRNIVSIIKTIDIPSPYTLGEIKDHINLKGDLKTVGEKVSIRANTMEIFKIEHNQWASSLHYLMSDRSTEYLYHTETLERLEKDYEGYEIKVLKNELDYFEEGTAQKNCVRGYLTDYNSLIFSIKKAEQRLTCEVNDGLLTQVRGICNSKPGEEWDGVINQMTLRISLLHNKDMLKPSVKIIYKKANVEKWVVLEGVQKDRVEMCDTIDDLPF